MKDQDLLELWQWKKLQTLRLAEVADLTRQMSQAISRRDEKSVDILLSLRADPLDRMWDAERKIRAFVNRLPAEDAARANELLGGARAVLDNEKTLSAQVAQYRRQLQTVQELDMRLSLSVGAGKSFYETGAV